MNRFLLILVPALAALGLLVAVVQAEGPGPDDLRAKAKQMLRQAEIAKSQGKEDLAHQMRENAQKLIHQAEELAGRREHAERREPQRPGREEAERREHARREIAEKIGSIERRMRELRQQGKREAVEDLEHQLRELRERMRHLAGPDRPRPDRPQPDRPHPQQPDRRVRLVQEATEHMQIASRLLHEADLHEPAEHLQQAAERLRQEVRKRMHGGEAEEMHRVIRELREEVGRLRRELEHIKHYMRESSQQR